MTRSFTGTFAAAAFLASLLPAAAVAGASGTVALDGDHRLLLIEEAGGQRLYHQLGTAAPSPLSAPHRDIERAEVVDSGVEGVVFAAWRERGGEELVSVSLDGGEVWSPPRRRASGVALHAAVVGPGRDEPIHGGPLAAFPDSSIWIVQLRTPSLAAWRRRLVELGAEVLGFLPANAHLVRIDPHGVERLLAEPFVRWVGPYHPIYRLEPALLAELGDPELPARRYVLQTFTAGEAEKGLLAAEVVAGGGEVMLMNPEGSLLEAMLSGPQALRLLASEHLQWLEHWRPRELDMDNARARYGADTIEAIAGYDGTGVRAEVLDGGIMSDHQDFDGMLTHGGVPTYGSHGTCTYGIVFGNGDRDGDGDPAATGLMPAAQGYFSDIVHLDNRYAHTAELVTSPIFAVFQSNSWGSGRTLHYTTASAELDDIIWTYDIPIFQSQSNSGDQYSRPEAWAKNVIAVGGVVHFDNQDAGDDCWCSVASIGPAADGRIKPDLSYWMDAIWTTDAEPGGFSPGLYADFGGTSGATPMVAGSAGLILQMYADNLWGNNPGLGTVFDKRPHATTLKALLINTAEEHLFSGLDHDLTRVRQGWGVPNLAAAHDRAALTAIVDEESVLTDLAFDAYLAEVGEGRDQLRVTMVYADRAANPAAAIHRVNDVTLKVVAPDGTVYWGNHGLEAGVWSTPGGGADQLNTVENVFVPNPPAGPWRIEVWADEINMDVHAETPEDDQDYALVVYGASAFSECRSPVPAPTGLAAAPAGDNQVSLGWSGTTASYEVWRSEGGCGLPAEHLATVSSPAYTDAAAAGGVTYGYLVRAVDGCPSPDSNCVEAETTGACTLPPRFDGLDLAVGASASSCAVDLSWSPASPRCGGPVVYNVYRSTDPEFSPGAGDRIAACVGTTSHLDSNLPSASATYAYVVRAEDLAGSGSSACGGSEDGNTRRRLLTPTTLLDTGFEGGLEGWVSIQPEPFVTGDWLVDDPEGTVDGTAPAQPEFAHGGNLCLYTARNPAAEADRADVDSGEVQVWSPTFDASPFSAVELRLWRWFYIAAPGVDSGNLFAIDVSSDGGSSWTNLETLGDSGGHNSWTEVIFDLEAFVPLTDAMVVRFRAAEGQTHATILEAAVDDVVVRGLDQCEPAVAIFSDGFESGSTSAWDLAVP